jgi:signal transduction histidine kinase
MRNSLKQSLPFFYKILLVFGFLVVLSTGFTAFIVYEQDKILLEKALAQELLSLVATLAPTINGNLHELIHRLPDGSIANEEEFIMIKEQLRRAKVSNRLPAKRGSPIYTLRPARDYETSGELEFVVMTDPGKDGKFFTGFRYPGQAHNRRALAGEPATSGIYEDDEGVWISACYPIRNQAGYVVAILQADRPVDFYQEEAYKIGRTILASALGGIAIAGVLALLLAGTISQPIQQLVQAHDRFGRGEREVRLPTIRKDELGNLMNSFNQMADSLSEANQQLENYSRTLEQKVLERTQELKQKNTELTTLNVEKNEFLGIVAHDLKNPLSGILGNADMVREFPAMARKEIEESMNAILQQANRMLTLITNLLDVNAIESGQMKIVMAPVDLSPLVASVAQTYRLRAEAKRIIMHEDYPPEKSMIQADHDVLVQILDNLISNAVKYSPTNKNIYLRVSHESGQVRFVVRDEGPGLSVEDQKRLFGKFARLTARPTAGESSTGLGLSIVKRMVESMQGRVWCETELGSGAAFLVEFPVATAIT